LFAEKIFDLPCLVSIDRLPEDVRRAAPPILSNGYVTFGVFNRPTKVSEEALDLWVRILRALPESRLLLKHGGFDVPSTQSRLVERFAMHGIAAERIAFRGATSREDHLAAFNEIDIALDPFPNTGGISTWEPLQMGVPVIAKLGDGIASRLGGAVLSAVGLAEWVGTTTDEYFAIATKFAAMPEHLDDLRRELPARLAESAAGNSVKYTRAVEAAYRKMWTDYCRGAPV
jgi:predicted O-linked N-acetylglucosamine transferase (SPINDLY family)